MPIIAVRGGGSYLLVATALLQFVGTVYGDKFPIDSLFASTAAGCVLLTAFPIPGCLLFGPSFGALFRHYLDCVWAPVKCAQFEFVGQCVAAIAFVPIVIHGFGWSAILSGSAVVLAVASLCVKADRRICADSRAPTRVLYSYGCICAGIGCFSLGGILVISDSVSKWGGDVTVVVATAAILVGALLAAVASGYRWPIPSHRYQLGAYVCSATAVTSMWATETEHFLAMSAAFGFGAGMVLINARSICFNASNVYFILSQRLADVVGPILLASGLEPRALMQAAPAFISLSLILLPTGIERLSDIRMAGIR